MMLKFIYSEKASKNLKNLQIHFDVMYQVISNKIQIFFQILQPSQNIPTVEIFWRHLKLQHPMHNFLASFTSNHLMLDLENGQFALGKMPVWSLKKGFRNGTQDLIKAITKVINLK